MAATTISDLSNVIKTLYRSGVEDLTLKDHPFLGTVPKEEGWPGDEYHAPMRISSGGGVGNLFSDAQEDVSPPQYNKWVLTRKSKYGFFDVSGEAIESMTGDTAGSYISTKQAEIDAKFQAMGQSTAMELFRYGNGLRGVATAASSTTVTQLATISDAQFFETGMTISYRDGSGADGDTAARYAEKKLVSGVNRITGAITHAAFSGAATVGDGVVVAGDALNAAAISTWSAGATSDPTSLYGLDAWLDAAGLLANTVSFCGVVRSNETRLQGNILAPATAYATVEEGLIDAAWACVKAGGRPDMCYINPTQHALLEKELIGRVQYEVVQAQGASGPIAKINFSAIVLNGPKGPIKVMADNNCPPGFGYMLDLSTWKLKHLGKLFRFANEDGNQILRKAGADSYEGRLVTRRQLYCMAPIFNARVVLPAA